MRKPWRTVVFLCFASILAACDQGPPGVIFDPQTERCVVTNDAEEGELETCEQGASKVRATLESVAQVQEEAFKEEGAHLIEKEQLVDAGLEIREGVSLRVDEVNRHGYCIEAEHEELPSAGVLFYVDQTGKVHGGGCGSEGHA